MEQERREKIPKRFLGRIREVYSDYGESIDVLVGGILLAVAILSMAHFFFGAI